MTAYVSRGTLPAMASESAGDEHPHFELQDVSVERPPEPMTVPPDYRPAKAAEVLELDMGDGVILYNHDSSLVHHLNPSAALLWRLCDGEASVGDLAGEIAEEYDLEPDTVLGEISGVIAEFDALNLVGDRAPDEGS
jgi:Coenzyme PQQ synthesis protein D (PqqD)